MDKQRPKIDKNSLTNKNKTGMMTLPCIKAYCVAIAIRQYGLGRGLDMWTSGTE